MRINSAFLWNSGYRPRRAPILAASTLAFLLTVQLALGAIPSANAATASPVVVWNQLTTTLGLGHKLQAPLFARAYALVQVAIWDALVQSQRKNPGNLAQVAVVAGAASEVLLYLFPDSSTQISATEDEQIAGIAGFNHGQVVSSTEIGSNVGDKIVTYARTDGSNAAWDGVIPTGPCKWTGTNPVGPTLGQAKTFILTSPIEFRPPPPYSCGSPLDLADMQVVIDAHNSLTPQEIAIVHKWADLPPPTIWNNMLDERIGTHSLSIFDAAHASVYLNVGMYDAFLSCWATKYTYWTARPFQRIPGFVPVIPTPISLATRLVIRPSPLQPVS